MSFNIMNLLAEAKGEVAPVFTKTFDHSIMAFPSAEERAAHAKSLSATAKPIAETEATNKTMLKKYDTLKELPNNLSASAKQPAPTRVVEKGSSKTTAAEAAHSERPSAMADKKPKSAIKELWEQHTRSTKRSKKVSLDTRKTVSRPMKKTSVANYQDDTKGSSGGIKADHSEKAATDVDTVANARSKKRNYEEFDLSDDDDFEKLEKLMKAAAPKVKPEPAFVPEPHAVPRPAKRKMKAFPGLAVLSPGTGKKGVTKTERSDKKVERKQGEKAVKKPFARSGSKSTGSAAKIEKQGAKKETLEKQKLCVEKNMANVLETAQSENLPGMRAMIAAAEKEQLRAAKK